MLSFPADWVYHAQHLQRLSTDGRDSLRAGLRELEAGGYITREQTRDEGGRLSAAAYTVTDDPRTVDGLSGDGKPADGKPAATNTYRTKTYRKEEGQQPASAPAHGEHAAAPPPLKTDPVSQALADGDSPEARAFLAAHGISTDQAPVWELQRFLRRTLGSQHEHPQVQANLTAWAGQHTLQEIRAAWDKAVARRAREPQGRLRAVHHFVDILNGTYQPDHVDGQAARAAAHAALPAFTPGERVITADGELLTVTDYDEAGQWLIFEDRPPLRPADVRRA